MRFPLNSKVFLKTVRLLFLYSSFYEWMASRIGNFASYSTSKQFFASLGVKVYELNDYLGKISDF